MEETDFEHFREVLLNRQQRLTEWLNTPASNRVEDAAIVRQLLADIDKALDRIEGESYGSCAVCDGEVEYHMLDVQPTRRVCLDCISDEERSALEEDLYLASTIHRALLPQQIPAIEGFEIGVRSLAATSIGGDYYDFPSEPDAPATRIVIADAMGKGLPGGLLMSNLQGALRILSGEFDSPGPLLARLNAWLVRNVPVTKFISLVCLELLRTNEPKTRVTYTNAGHCPPILFRKDGTVERLDVTGGVLGVHERFTYYEETLDLSSGDSLLLYTDGLTEAENAEGEQYEEDRVIDFLRNCRGVPPEAAIDALIGDVVKFAGTSQPGDDLTVILLRKK